MSHFFYIHRDLRDHPDVNKIGIAISPYSAVRARQKFCWDRVGLDHVYFGMPNHIRYLETIFKQKYFEFSGKHLNRRGGQSELFKMTEKEILNAVNNIVNGYKLNIKKLELTESYTASNSQQCPLKLPPESQLHNHCNREVSKIWGTPVVESKTTAFNLLFVDPPSVLEKLTR